MATVWHRAVIAGLLLTPAALRSAYAQRVIFVKADAAGANDGSSWTDAFVDLQDALAVALAGDEIWVAEGTYRPDRGTGDRMMAFELVCGVGLYGGFGGWEECREERDWNANETILSGDLLGDDGPRVCEQVSNCCYAHEGVGCDNAACQALVCSVLSPYDECCYADQPFIAWSQSCADSAR